MGYRKFCFVFFASFIFGCNYIISFKWKDTCRLKKLLNQNTMAFRGIFLKQHLLRTGGCGWSNWYFLLFPFYSICRRALDSLCHCIEDSLIYHFRGSRSKKVESTGYVCVQTSRVVQHWVVEYTNAISILRAPARWLFNTIKTGQSERQDSGLCPQIPAVRTSEPTTQHMDSKLWRKQKLLVDFLHILFNKKETQSSFYIQIW